jgi:hypothetical protein
MHKSVVARASDSSVLITKTLQLTGAAVHTSPIYCRYLGGDVEALNNISSRNVKRRGRTSISIYDY